MRIISGIYKGQKLIPIDGKDIRPTTDRARESLFNIIGNKVYQAKILDLFAGTGAFGIEAISRGASTTIFADNSPKSCEIIKNNLIQCAKNDLPKINTKILCKDILSNDFFSLFEKYKFDLIFLDPPYHKDIASQIITSGRLISCLSPEGMIIAEHSPKECLEKQSFGLNFLRKKKYGNSMFSFFGFI